jgi:two-component system OmpR family sensor kinase
MGLTNLRGRMISFAAIGTTALVAVVAILTQLLAANASEADARAIARARADGITAGVRVVHGRLHVLEGTNDFLDTTAWVFDASGHLVEGSVPTSARSSVRRLVLERRERYATRGLYLFYVRPFTTRGVSGSVVAIVDLRPFEASERRLLDAVLLLGVITICVAASIAAIVVNRSLGVVRQMSEQADQWQGHDLSRRFGLGTGRDEITELGRTLDHMLDRINDALASERRITDEIAHELRTPLAGLRAEAQWGRAHASGMAADALDAVLAAADRMDSALSTVLDSARARVSEPGGCDAARVVRGLLVDGETLDAQGRTAVTTSSEVVSALLAPLLENARLHRATRSWVKTTEAADGVAVHVHDDGPGFAPGDTETAFTPGWSRTGGHGLGLAVVRRLAASHAIPVSAHPGPGGHVELRFPRP